MTQRPAAAFTQGWLDLREPVDHRSRSALLAGRLDEWLRQRLAEAGSTILHAVDLGAGAGSNWRYLSAHLGVPLRWRLLDQDAALLAQAQAENARVVTEVTDLARPLSPRVERADLVTASALIDLAGRRWIEALVHACDAARAAVLIALTIDGHVAFDPPDPLDAQMLAWVARDEQREKGLGVALGPAAAAALAAALQTCGYAVMTAPSDWQLEPVDASLALALLDGWCLAARRQCPARGTAIDAWSARRAAAIEGRRLRVRVGHQDVLGLPRKSRS